MRYVLALDQGTTSSRSIIFNEQGKLIAVDQIEFKQHFPAESWVEHDPDEIFNTQTRTIRNVIARAGVDASDITAAGITNQRETVVAWNRQTGSPVGRAIVWQDRRTDAMCRQLVAEGLTGLIRSKTGLIPDAYFSATKMQWILQNNPEASRLAAKGELCFGTIDSWLLYRLSGGKLHITDISNASRTMLFNIISLEWDEELLSLFGIPMSSLPGVVPSCGASGFIDQSIAGAEIPVTGIAGDQQASLFGQLCFKPGMIKNTYGTGCFMLGNIGTQPQFSDSGLLTTIAWQIEGITEYALEGSVFIAGAAIQWLRDGLKVILSAGDSEQMAASLDGNSGVYFVPAFAGLGTPHWDDSARGMIIGLTRATESRHIVRAALEAIAYQTRDIVDSMTQVSGKPPGQIRVDGGASRNDFLMQFQADILGLPVVRPVITESTALGAAFLAGIGCGLWSKQQVSELVKIDRRFDPEAAETDRQLLYTRWKEAVKRARGWEQN